MKSSLPKRTGSWWGAGGGWIVPTSPSEGGGWGGVDIEKLIERSRKCYGFASNATEHFSYITLSSAATRIARRHVLAGSVSVKHRHPVL